MTFLPIVLADRLVLARFQRPTFNLGSIILGIKDISRGKSCYQFML